MSETKSKSNESAQGCAALIVVTVVLVVIGAVFCTGPSEKEALKVLVSETPEDAIKRFVSGELGSDLISLKADRLTADVHGDRTLNHDKQAWSVRVSYRAIPGGFMMSAKEHMDIRMMEIFRNLYTAEVPIKTVSIEAYLDLVDRFGNVEEELVYSTTMEYGTGSRVNWDNFAALIGRADFPDLFDVRFMHNAIRE